jgi:V/A-type H+-transporting ATPase subunit A
MMKVVGEEGTSLEDYIVYLKSDFLDAVYFQQNSFDEIDAAADVERQTYVFKKLLTVLGSGFALETKDDARSFFNQMRQKFLDWNYSKWQGSEFKQAEADIDALYGGKSGKAEPKLTALLKEGN